MERLLRLVLQAISEGIYFVDIILDPKVLEWARKRAGLSEGELAKKVGVKEERVAQWEQSGELTLANAETLAAKTHTPLGYLFLDEPPEIPLPIADFRTPLAEEIQEASIDLRDIVNQALDVQDWYRDYLISIDEEPRGFVGQLRVVQNSQEIINAADYMRRAVGWSNFDNRSSSRVDVALERYIDAAEDAGILVMQTGHVPPNTRRKLKKSEFRGFALADKYAPLVFINLNDFESAKIFTLAHEIVHIGLGESGISNPNPTFSRNRGVERFCNAVAAEMLVPIRALRQIQQSAPKNVDIVAFASNYFNVSSLVILRRLHEIDAITDEELQIRYYDEIGEEKEKPAKKSGGGNWYSNVRGRLGDRFLRALVVSTLSGQTTFRDAGRLIGSQKTDSLYKLGRELKVIS